MFLGISKGAWSLSLGIMLWLLVSLITGSLCWLQSFVGLPCPGCGSVRAVQYLVQGDFGEAFSFHPLILVSLVLIIYLAVRFVLLKNSAQSKAENSILLFIAAVYVFVYAVRMLLFFPHTEPFVPLEDALWRQVFRLVSHLLSTQ